MPPRKERQYKLEAEDECQMVLKYLVDQNRPYSTIEISANLHNKVTKGQCAKAVKELEEKGLIASKTSGLTYSETSASNANDNWKGKQTVYYPPQTSPKGITLATEGTESTEAIGTLREKANILRSREKVLKSELQELTSALTRAELEAEVQRLVAEHTALAKQLDDIKDDTKETISPDEALTISTEWSNWSADAGLKKQRCMSLWHMLQEALPDTEDIAELWDELGLQGDEQG